MLTMEPILASPYFLAALVGLSGLTACNADAGAESRSSEITENGSGDLVANETADAGAVVEQTSVPAKIDPNPVDAAISIVVDKQDISVNGEPACAFTIRYPDAVDQPVTWNRQPCSALTTEFMSFSKLTDMGKIDRLSEETVEDLKRGNMTNVFYIENDVTASIYPLNVAGRIYEVIVSD